MNGQKVLGAFSAVLLILLVACLLSRGVEAAECYPLDVTKIRDGDTIEGSGLVIRLAGIDAPETWPGQFQCERERMLGLLAKQRASQLIFSASERQYCPLGVDRYQRTLATVLADGEDVGRALVVDGLAREWDGARRSWCNQP